MLNPGVTKFLQIAIEITIATLEKGNVQSDSYKVAANFQLQNCKSRNVNWIVSKSLQIENVKILKTQC